MTFKVIKVVKVLTHILMSCSRGSSSPHHHIDKFRIYGLGKVVEGKANPMNELSLDVKVFWNVT